MNSITIQIKDVRLLQKAERLLGKNWKQQLGAMCFAGARAALGMTADLSIKEVSIMLCVSVTTVQRMLTRGDFPKAYHVNARKVRIPLADVEALKSRTVLLPVNA